MPDPTPEAKTDVTIAPDAAKATSAETASVDNKSTPAPAVKTEDKAATETPAEELKTLLDEAGEEKKEEGIKPVVPEKYEFKIPEGMELDPEKLAVAEPLFKELGLSNDQAQKLVDLQAQIVKGSEDAHVKAWDQYIEDRKKESKDFFGIKLPEVMRNVARSRDQFVHKELQEKFNVSGLANDKDFLVFMDKVGRVVGEGKFIEGKISAPAKGDGSVETTGPSLAEVYPSMAKK